MSTTHILMYTYVSQQSQTWLRLWLAVLQEDTIKWSRRNQARLHKIKVKQIALCSLGFIQRRKKNVGLVYVSTLTIIVYSCAYRCIDGNRWTHSIRLRTSPMLSVVESASAYAILVESMFESILLPDLDTDLDTGSLGCVQRVRSLIQTFTKSMVEI